MASIDEKKRPDNAEDWSIDKGQVLNQNGVTIELWTTLDEWETRKEALGINTTPVAFSYGGDVWERYEWVDEKGEIQNWRCIRPYNDEDVQQRQLIIDLVESNEPLTGFQVQKNINGLWETLRS